MAQPQAYNRETDFTERDGDDTNHAGINTELDAAALSINEIRDNLALIQRDDGALQNGIVTAESLAPSAFDAVLVEVNVAVGEAQTAAASANNAAVSANTARDEAVAAKDTAVTSANAAALNATTATAKAAESAASATASQASATASANSASASQTSRLASETARDLAQAAQAAASASQTAAAASQTAAATSETNAASSATTATTQAATATTQASNAAASATAAAASFDQFEDLYLGSKTADPTTDNDGNALLSGALYFNSVAGEMRVWADTFWKATGSSVGGTINTAKYTATAGQTTFAIVYDVGFVHVYQNGVKLESGVDFTANNGTSVVLATPAIVDDVVDMIAFGIFSVANTYAKAEADARFVHITGDTMTGPITVDGSILIWRGSNGQFSSSAFGVESLREIVNGSLNTALGSYSLSLLASGTNCTGVGVGSQVTGSNQVQLGNSDTTTYVYGTVQNRSDERDKADVQDTTLGLDFINALRPVDFKWDIREDYRPERPTDLPENATTEQKAAHRQSIEAWLDACKPENITRDGSKKRHRFHHGLVAQEVKALLDAWGIDFGGYQDHKVLGGEDVLSIGYDELIAPLIKAVQQLSAEIEALKAQIN